MLAELKAAAEPYLLVIRITLWAALAGGLFVSGCRHGVSTTREDAQAAAEKRVTAAEKRANDNFEAASACGAALDEVSRNTAAAQAQAEQQRAAVEAAQARATASAQAAQAQADAAARALKQAQAQPVCAAQLEIELCPSIPVL